MDFNPSLLYRLNRGEFVVSVQLDPPRSADLGEFMRLVDKFRDCGVQVFDINSSRRLSQDSMHLAALLQGRGLTTIPHITSRDATPDGLLKQALAACGQGVRSFLAITGDRYDPLKSASGTAGVFHGDSITIIQAMDQRLRKNAEISAPLCLGASIDQNVADLNLERERAKVKIAYGTDFFMSQPVFGISDALRLKRFADSCVDRPVLMGVWPLVSKKTIENIAAGKVKGVVLPDHVLRQAQELFEDEYLLQLWGTEEAYRLIAWVRKTRAAQGIYFIAPSRNPEQILKLVEQIMKLA